MNENNRIGEVQKGVNRFVDTLADSGITNNINMGYVGYSSDGYNNNAIQMGRLIQSKIQLKILRQVALEEELSLKKH